MKLPFLLLLLLALLCGGCKKEDSDLQELKVPRLMVETRGVQYGALGGQVVQLPISNTKIVLQKEPLVNEFDIVNAELVRVEMGLALLLQTNERGARALYRGTVTNMGGRIILTINNNAVAARRVDGPIQDGNFYTFVELEDEALEQLVLDLKASIQKLQKL